MVEPLQQLKEQTKDGEESKTIKKEKNNKKEILQIFECKICCCILRNVGVIIELFGAIILRTADMQFGHVFGSSYYCNYIHILWTMGFEPRVRHPKWDKSVSGVEREALSWSSCSRKHVKYWSTYSDRH